MEAVLWSGPTKPHPARSCLCSTPCTGPRKPSRWVHFSPAIMDSLAPPHARRGRPRGRSIGGLHSRRRADMARRRSGRGGTGQHPGNTSNWTGQAASSSSRSNEYVQPRTTLPADRRIRSDFSPGREATRRGPQRPHPAPSQAAAANCEHRQSPAEMPPSRSKGPPPPERPAARMNCRSEPDRPRRRHRRYLPEREEALSGHAKPSGNTAPVAQTGPAFVRPPQRTQGRRPTRWTPMREVLRSPRPVLHATTCSVGVRGKVP